MKRKDKGNIRKAVVFLFALGVLPFSVSLLIHFPTLFERYNSFTGELIWASIGFALFTFLFFVFGAPVRSYIVQHELSHLLFALLCGVRIREVSLKRDSAHVKTDRINILIALAPYSLPLYTLFFIVLQKIICHFFEKPFLSLLFYFIIGLTAAFHIIATLHYLQIEQPDLKRYGYFSSLILIFTWSLVILALLLALIFDRVPLIGFFRASFEGGLDIYGRLFVTFSNYLTRIF